MTEVRPEDLMTLAEAAQKKLPKRKNGKPLHTNTLGRWANKGLRGVVLETVRVGGMIYTTAAFVDAFCSRLRAPVRPRAVNRSEPSDKAKKANEAARKALALEGFNCATTQVASA